MPLMGAHVRMANLLPGADRAQEQYGFLIGIVGLLAVGIVWAGLRRYTPLSGLAAWSVLLAVGVPVFIKWLERENALIEAMDQKTAAARSAAASEGGTADDGSAELQREFEEKTAELERLKAVEKEAVEGGVPLLGADGDASALRKRR